MYERLGKISGDKISFFATHPSSENRVKVRVLTLNNNTAKETDDWSLIAFKGGITDGVLDP